MRTKTQVCITIDKHCIEALKHIISKGRYKSMSNAIEQMIIKDINSSHFDNLITKIMHEINRPLFEDEKTTHGGKQNE